MNIRKATIQDIPAILLVVKDAQAYLKEKGIDQWQHGYPDATQFESDIADGGSYVLVEENEIVGTCFIGWKPDPFYSVIEQGQWLNDHPYGVLHRTAVFSKLKGQNAAGLFVEKALKLAKEKGITDLRADTHEKNISMQHFLKKHGFVQCGIVYVQGHSKRFAFHRKWGENYE